VILLIYDCDSFAYNLLHLIGDTQDVSLKRSDETSLEEVMEMSPSHIIISAGFDHLRNKTCKEIVRHMRGHAVILGVCSGHQAICEVFGASIISAEQPMYGKQSSIHIANGSPIFKRLPPIIQVGRYHSSVVEKLSLPDEILVIAESDRGEVMGVKHRYHEIYGLQFNPESILTPQGDAIMRNFLSIGGENR